MKIVQSFKSMSLLSFLFGNKGKAKSKPKTKPKIGYYVVSYKFNGFSSTYPVYAYSKQEAINALLKEYPDATDITTTQKSKQ